MTSPPVIAHIVESCKGGVGTFVANLIRSQADDADMGAVHLLYDPTLLGDMLHDAPAEHHAYESSRSPLRQLAVARAVKNHLDRIAPDVVFLHATFPGVYGRIDARTPWRRIYCAHGWSFCQDIPPLKRKFYETVERLLSSRCDAIVDISDFEFGAAKNVGLRAPIHRHIPHGLPARRADITKAVDINPARINLGFVGRFDRQKGVDILLAQFADGALSHIDLWLIGDTVRDGDSVRLPASANIHALGWVPNAELDSYLACFDALVVPSRWEGFGLVALEAMRNGKSVIASRVGGLPEIITHGHDGFLFDIRSDTTCRELLMSLDKDELGRMGRNALETFERRFRWDMCYAQWKALTGEVLRTKP
jgi:glycosyltransferase involved in cell wall biosynthesis